jgi:hypothetical protein
MIIDFFDIGNFDLTISPGLNDRGGKGVGRAEKAQNRRRVLG